MDATGPTKNLGNNDSTGSPFFKVCGLCGAVRSDNQIGLELTPDGYVQAMVGVCREVWRVLRKDGTFWLNLGDSYAGASVEKLDGYKSKDLVGIPWKVAFALQSDGWYLRSDIIWNKPNPMPESMVDRPTKAHEYLFLLAKSDRYYYDAFPVRENMKGLAPEWRNRAEEGYAPTLPSGQDRWSPGTRVFGLDGMRNKRDVWTIITEPTPEAHFATFPQRLVEPCIMAGSSERGCCAECGAPRMRVVKSFDGRHWTEKRGSSGRKWKVGNASGRNDFGGDFKNDWQSVGWKDSCSCGASSVPCRVLDPFLGSGTTGQVAERLGRRWVGLDLSVKYIDIALRRTAQRGFNWISGGSLG